ncbi:hypothetical protein BH23ACT10_BH23ACT10_30000 [soil metagenome]
MHAGSGGCRAKPASGEPCWDEAERHFRRAAPYWFPTSSWSIYDQQPDAQAVRPLLAWHWHPGTRDHPHLHVRGDSDAVGSLHKLHVPTRRVTFEAVIDFVITDLDVEPVRDDWHDQLSDATRRVEKHLNWR